MKPIEIPFAKDYMTAKDLKACAASLQEILRLHDRIEDPVEFYLHVKAIRKYYKVDE